MAIDYFSNFPDIIYKNQTAKHILLRAALRDVTRTATDVMLPLTLEYGERTDMIANDLYKNSGYDWLVKFGNKTLDPYFDWPLTDYDLTKYIEKKYGDLPTAQSTVLYYLHSNGDTKINTDTYSLLSGGEQANYTPVYAYDEIVSSNDKKLLTSLIAPEFASTIDNELEKKLNE